VFRGWCKTTKNVDCGEVVALTDMTAARPIDVKKRIYVLTFFILSAFLNFKKNVH